MEDSKGRGPKKWGVVGLSFAALGMSSVIRISLGVAAPTLMEEYDISPAAMGYVLSGWNWAYTACQLIMGPVVDRFGSWIVLGLGASVWSLSTIALPLATTALGLFLFRAVFGIGHSMLIPAQGATISKWFPSEQRSTALGFAFSGSQVGSAVGALACASLLASYGRKPSWGLLERMNPWNEFPSLPSFSVQGATLWESAFATAAPPGGSPSDRRDTSMLITFSLAGCPAT